ncbi:hypothetical protein HY612_03720 [Candidatus Roizmanbacteria bacterium]|nr:hypothetical protein [Candidatus Roizmanbacteria bacterium]
MNKKIYIGIVLFLLSYLQFLLPNNLIFAEILTIFWFLFMLGIILISDGLTQSIKHKSLLYVVLMNKKNFFSFIIISAIGALLLDGVAQWLGKLWIYPYFNFYFYFVFFFFGFSFYWLMIAESYLAVKAIIDYLKKGKQIVQRTFRFEQRLYNILGVIGVILILLSLILIFNDYLNQGGYIFDISKNTGYKVNFLIIIMIFVGIWFVFEYIEYKYKKTSLLKDIIHHYPTPLVSILVASFLLALVMEIENLYHGFWVYTNWPLEEIRFLNLPVIMLLAWPLHYVGFLSLFRAFTEKESDEIWRGDLIK